MKYPEEGNQQRQKIDQWFPESENRKEWRLTANGFQVSYGDDENGLKLDSDDGWLQNSVNTIKHTELHTLKR